MGNVIKWYGRAFTEGLYKHVDKRVAKLANKVKDKVKSNAPIDTGELRASIRVEKIKKMEYAVKSDVDYALDVEFGTSTQSAQPYFRPALRSVKGL